MSDKNSEELDKQLAELGASVERMSEHLNEVFEHIIWYNEISDSFFNENDFFFSQFQVKLKYLQTYSEYFEPIFKDILSRFKEARYAAIASKEHINKIDSPLYVKYPDSNETIAYKIEASIKEWKERVEEYRKSREEKK